MQILKQSTAVDVLIGPFVDRSDGYTAETGESPTVKLSKNGQTLGAKNDATTPTHDADGYYNCELDATDTNTVGTLTLTVAASANALPVRHEFQVLEEAIYDALYGSGAGGFDSNARVDVGSWNGTSLGTTNPLPNAAPGDADGLFIAGTNAPVTITGSGDALSLISSGGGGTGLVVTGEGDGYGINVTSGSGFAADAIQAVSAATNGAGLRLTGAGTNEDMEADISGSLSGSVGSISGVTFPTNFEDLAITVTDGYVTAGTVDDKTGYSISGTKNTLDDLNDIDGSSVTLANGAHGGAAASLTLSDYSDFLATGFSTHAAADVWSVATRVLTANTNLNDLSAADVNAEVDAAIETYHLDHLLAVDYDPSSPPGIATALLNELVENDAGEARFTVNALENAPSGSGASAETIADAVWNEARSGHVDAGSFGETLGTVETNIDNLDASISGLNDIAAADVWSVGTRVLTANTNLNDPTAAAIADAVLQESVDDHKATVASLAEHIDAIHADTDELQGNQGDWATATGFSTHAAADVTTHMDANSTQLADIVGDTNELQTDWANGGRLDLILDELTTQGDTNESKIDTVDGVVDAILADTNELQGNQANWATATMSDIFETGAMTESYAGVGAEPTPAEALYLIQQYLTEFVITGTSYSVKQLDGTTEAADITLNDDTSPTSATRNP